jgi:hypothetical protein
MQEHNFDDRTATAPMTREPAYGQQPGYGQQPVYGQQYGYGRGGGYGGGQRARRQYPIETKPFFLTSEFAALVSAIVALAITAAVDNSIDAWRFWLLATPLVALYMLSRGIAKAGTKSNSFDPREQLELGRRDGADHQHQAAGH